MYTKKLKIYKSLTLAQKTENEAGACALFYIKVKLIRGDCQKKNPPWCGLPMGLAGWGRADFA